MKCDSCQLLRINGVICHETGCPDAWIGQPKICFDCGCEFTPEVKHARVCNDCFYPTPNDDCEEYDADA